MIGYGYQILNAQIGKDGKVDLEARTHVYRDGDEIYTGKPTGLSGAGQANAKRLLVGGVFHLARDASPGHYLLQIVVTDNLANEKYKKAAQWADFEVR